jgi:hypothetical protein
MACIGITLPLPYLLLLKTTVSLIVPLPSTTSLDTPSPSRGACEHSKASQQRRELTRSRLQGLGQLKNPTNSSGIEPASFRFVAQCLNQLRYSVHCRIIGLVKYELERCGSGHGLIWNHSGVCLDELRKIMINLSEYHDSTTDVRWHSSYIFMTMP